MSFDFLIYLLKNVDFPIVFVVLISQLSLVTNCIIAYFGEKLETPVFFHIMLECMCQLQTSNGTVLF